MANVYLNAKLTPSSQASTALYSCPDFKTGVLKSILACNPSSGALSVTITLGSSFLFNAKQIAANETIELLTAPLVVQATEVVSVEGTGSVGLNIVASILEIS
jgi:hypothetical protein